MVKKKSVKKSGKNEKPAKKIVLGKGKSAKKEEKIGKDKKAEAENKDEKNDKKIEEAEVKFSDAKEVNPFEVLEQIENNNKLFDEKSRKKSFLELFFKNKKHNLKPRRKYKIKPFLERSGFGSEPSKVLKNMFLFSVIINMIFTALAISKLSGNPEYNLRYVFFVVFVLWVPVLLGIFLVVWLCFNVFMDLRAFSRKNKIEESLPDYLQLTASNIRSGMPVDRALWLSVRPRFGILAKEIEIVAKQTMSGISIEAALESFANRYDSTLLKRSINLLIVGLEAGGEIGNLLDKISSDIKDSQILKKEMSANVSTYAIFITFASIVGAPFLFALSAQLLNIIQTIMADIHIDPSTDMGFTLSTGGGIALGDFKIFAIVCLIITSFFSATIVATIKKGSIKAGIRYIPVFIVVSITIFLVCCMAFQKVLGGLF